MRTGERHCISNNTDSSEEPSFTSVAWGISSCLVADFCLPSFTAQYRGYFIKCFRNHPSGENEHPFVLISTLISGGMRDKNNIVNSTSRVINLIYNQSNAD